MSRLYKRPLESKDPTAEITAILQQSKGRVVNLVVVLLLLSGVAVIAALSLSPRPSLTGDAPASTAYYSEDDTLLRLELAADERYRLFLPLAQMPEALLKATLLQEDRHFYRHPGVNPFSLLRAAYETYIARSRPIGGSTLTMQLVRLRDKLDTRRMSGKLSQFWRALVLEYHYPKAHILEAYLNLAPYGGNIEGVGAASLIYFGRRPKELALPQCLALAVIPQNPVQRRPLSGDNTAWREARLRLFEIYTTRYSITKNSRPLMRMPLAVRNRSDLPFMAPHFLNSLPKNDAAVVQTTLDLTLQTLLEDHLKEYVRQNGLSGVDNAAAMLLDTRDMTVRALVGSADFFNTAIDGQVDGTAAWRSPGSTLKSFVYALALDQGLIHPKSLLEDVPTAFTEYRPANFDNTFMGRIPATTALHLSRNVPAIALANQLAAPDLYTFLTKAGLDLPHAESHYGLSLVIGGAELRMRDLVGLYAMLANGGVLAAPRYTRALALTDSGISSASKRLLSPEAAYLTLLMLERPYTRDETAFANAPDRLPVYWKTGTSSGMRDAWTVGLFGPYVLATWVGHFDGRRNPALVGSRMAAPLFFKIVKAIIADTRPSDLIYPALEALNVQQVALCGQAATPGLPGCDLPVRTFFIAGKSPIMARQITRAPRIISPQPGIDYALLQHNAAASLPLEARFDKPQYPLFWFAGKRLIGVSHDGAPIFWRPRPGVHTIRVLDAAANSAATAIRVISAR